MSRRANSPTNIPASRSGSAASSPNAWTRWSAGLLEGAAFLAARVQLKLKHEFPEFTGNLLEQLVPNYLAPTPSVMLAKVVPPFADPALRDGRRIARGAYLDATYRELDRNVACRYRLTSDITLWPFDIVGAEYFTSAAPLQALGLSAGSDARGRHAAVAHASHRGAARGRAARRAGAEDAERLVRRLPHHRAAGLSDRQRGGFGRALRAAVRRLRRHLLPLSR